MKKFDLPVITSQVVARRSLPCCNAAMDTLTPSSETALDFPGLLRYWRGKRGYSQLALSLAAGVSQRHISFLDSGRACYWLAVLRRPTANMGWRRPRCRSCSRRSR
jgi:hypothetical protein